MAFLSLTWFTNSTSTPCMVPTARTWPFLRMGPCRPSILMTTIHPQAKYPSMICYLTTLRRSKAIRKPLPISLFLRIPRMPRLQNTMGIPFVFHNASPSVRFNPFAYDEPIVEQSPSKGQSYPEDANAGRLVFTNPFDNSSNILSDAILGLAPNERIYSSPQQQYTAIPTEHTYTPADHDQVQSYASSQSIYSQYGGVSRTNTDNSRSRSFSRTFVDDCEPVAPRIFYWVDQSNKLRRISGFMSFDNASFCNMSIYTGTLANDFVITFLDGAHIKIFSMT